MGPNMGSERQLFHPTVAQRHHVASIILVDTGRHQAITWTSGYSSSVKFSSPEGKFIGNAQNVNH